jgi:serine/threonine protein kinase
MLGSVLQTLAARPTCTEKLLAWGVGNRSGLFHLVVQLNCNALLLRILCEAAEGTANLHRDIACRNILLDSQLGALVCDLGYAREMASGGGYARKAAAAAAAADEQMPLL